MRISDWSSDVCSSDLAAHPRVVGIGETGLDYYYDKSDRARQQDSFRRHIHASQRTGLPIIVHTRDAEADTLALLGEEKDRESFDRKRVVSGKSVSVRVSYGGCRIIKKQQNNYH